jgi:hypothetical protein
MLFSFLPTVMPGVLRSMMKAVKALPAGSVGDPVRASRKYQFATPPAEGRRGRGRGVQSGEQVGAAEIEPNQSTDWRPSHRTN